MCSVMSFCKLWSSHLVSSLSVGKSGLSLARDPYPVIGLVSSYTQTGTTLSSKRTYRYNTKPRLCLCNHSLVAGKESQYSFTSRQVPKL